MLRRRAVRKLPAAFNEMRVLGRNKHHGQYRQVCKGIRDLTTSSLMKPLEGVQGGEDMAQNNNRHQEASDLAVQRLDPVTKTVVSKPKLLFEPVIMS